MGEPTDVIAAMDGVRASLAKIQAAAEPKPLRNNNLTPGEQAFADGFKLPGGDAAKRADETDDRFSGLSPATAAFARSLKIPG